MIRLRFALLILLPLAILTGLARLASAEQMNPPPTAPRHFKDCSNCPEMVAIPAGRFTMGSPMGEVGRFDTEGPRHNVSVRPFALGIYDVTDDEFLAFLRETGYEPDPCDKLLGLSWRSPRRGIAYPPGSAESPQQPAVCLNWFDAKAYIAWLNKKIGGNQNGPYRLPSEAEWEYAARAGTTTTRWWGNAIGKNNANCNGCGSKWDNDLFAPSGTFGPNPFGLYDMLGNAWQWVEDCWNESYLRAPTDGSAWMTGDCSKRVLRGGSWDNLPNFVRSAARSRSDARNGDFDYASYAGFRVAKTLP